MASDVVSTSAVFSGLGLRAHPPTIARLMSMALENPALLSLAAGFTDNRTLPVASVRAAVEALTEREGDPEFLQYGSNQGRPGLRRLLAERLVGLEPDLDATTVAGETFVTNGSQQALYLAMQVLCEPGDIVLVDRPSYFVYLEMLAGLGVQARSIPVDGNGRLDEVAFRNLLRAAKAGGEAARFKAIYFVSYYSNPSGRSLSGEEKSALGEILSEEQMVLPVVEDAAYRELYYRAPSAAPSVLTQRAWSAFPKLYLSTLTKPFASGLKVGYGVCTNPEWRAKMLHVKGHQDFGSANFNQAICEHVLGSGDFEAQLVRIRPAYEAKMRALHEALEREGLKGLGWSWEVPDGGLYLWLRAPDGIDTGMESPFCHQCIGAGVLYVPGELCFGDEPPRNYARLSFGVLAEPELAEAAQRFVSVAKRFSA